ncbi:MAG: hypothetical protein QJR14_06465 [Bacillota bacterium]|nr:hypothetical protein [Bacillota bacterium]
MGPVIGQIWQDAVNLLASLYPLLGLLVGLIIGFAVAGGIIDLLRRRKEDSTF